MKALFTLFPLLIVYPAAKANLSNVHHATATIQLPVSSCGTEYGCFALPNNTCLQSPSGENCSSLAMYKRRNDHSYEFRLYQREPRRHLDGYWIALGLSNADNQMPNTSMVECRLDYNTWPSPFLMQSAFALNYTRPVLRHIAAVYPEAAVYGAGGIGCWFHIEKIMVAGDHVDDLSKPTFLLLAHGRIDNSECVYDGKFYFAAAFGLK